MEAARPEIGPIEIMDYREKWEFRIFIAGRGARYMTALRDLRSLLEESIPGRYHIEIIDIKEDPERAREEQVLAVPAVSRVMPPPEKRVIGDLTEKNQVRKLLGLPSRTPAVKPEPAEGESNEGQAGRKGAEGGK